jgi:hypothetical protein
VTHHTAVHQAHIRSPISPSPIANSGFAVRFGHSLEDVMREIQIEAVSSGPRTTPASLVATRGFG